MTWAIRTSWRFEPVEVVKETAKMVFYIDRGWSMPRESRQEKKNFLPWRGDEETARQLTAKLTSALAEYERRRKATSEWYAGRKAEILASVDTHPKGGDVQQAPSPMSGAVPPEEAGDAQTTSQNPLPRSI